MDRINKLNSKPGRNKNRTAKSVSLKISSQKRKGTAQSNQKYQKIQENTGKKYKK